MSNDSRLIQRYSAGDRVQHWITAISFILLALSGLALFHPAFFFFTHLLGGGQWTRILHPFIGVVLVLAFFPFAVRLARHNHMTAADREWQRRAFDVLMKRAEGVPEVGRYNAGQKRLFWIMVWMIALLLVTGVVIWQPWFAPYFSVDLNRVAVLLHALGAFIIILGIVGHVYMAYWTRSMEAMTRGTVTPAWAKHHHPGWYREVSKGAK
jgi:formate dehydrogenase subunit gamma